MQPNNSTFQTFISDVAGERADAYLASVSGKTRAKIASLIDEGHVLINSEKAKKSSKLKLNDKIEIYFKPEELPDLTPKEIPFEVVKDEENYAIINKPAGLTVHPAAGNFSDTLVNALLYKFSIEDNDNGFRPGIVHRLDKDTSGLLVIAKNADAREKLSSLFAKREVDKRYLAICHGVPKFKSVVVEKNIGRDARNRKRMAVTTDGKYAKSEFIVKEIYKNAFLAEVKIYTGRTHQIRVHASSIGHPLVGDVLYGGKPLFGFARQALHSAFISFQDPFNGKLISISSQMPEDMLELQERLEKL